jgi:ribosomal protein L40E
MQMICPKCKAENNEGADYCSLCYTKFSGPSIGLGQDDIYAVIAEKHKEARILCPNCEDISPISSLWCIKCGFIFENREELIVSDERALEIQESRRSEADQDLRQTMSEPLVISSETDGGAIIRSVQDILRTGRTACLHARGRNAITYAMKLITLMSEEMRNNNKDLKIRSYLLTEEQLVHPDDLAVELLLELT